MTFERNQAAEAALAAAAKDFKSTPIVKPGSEAAPDFLTKNGGKGHECPICSDQFDATAVIIPGGHTFHSKCLKDCLKVNHNKHPIDQDAKPLIVDPKTGLPVDCIPNRAVRDLMPVLNRLFETAQSAGDLFEQNETLRKKLLAAQDDPELRRDNLRLKSQTTTLTLQADELKAEIAKAKAEAAEAKAALAKANQTIQTLTRDLNAVQIDKQAILHQGQELSCERDKLRLETLHYKKGYLKYMREYKDMSADFLAISRKIVNFESEDENYDAKATNNLHQSLLQPLPAASAAAKHPSGLPRSPQRPSTPVHNAPSNLSAAGLTPPSANAAAFAVPVKPAAVPPTVSGRAVISKSHHRYESHLFASARIPSRPLSRPGSALGGRSNVNQQHALSAAPVGDSKAGDSKEGNRKVNQKS